MDPIAMVMQMLGQQMGAPTPGKPPTIGAMPFDKRFAGAPGAPGMTQGYPIDDDALLRAMQRRRMMMNGDGQAPLLGDMAYDMGMMNR